MTGCALHPRSRSANCAKRNAAHEHTGSAENTPASPAQWLYGLYDFVLVTGLIATIAASAFARDLTPAPGRRTQSTSPYASAALVSRSLASTAPCPSFATMATAPPAGQDSGSHKSDLPDGATDLFSFRGIDTISENQK